MADAQPQKAGAKYGLLRSLCYESTTDFWREPEDISGRTCARTDGTRLIKYNTDHYAENDIETEFVELLHEVTHTGGGDGFGRGSCSHNPDFWEEYQENFIKITQSEQARRLVESAFGPRVFDWTRARHRAVQNATQVDNRCETVDERRALLADAIGHDTHGQWKEVGLHSGPRNDEPVYTGPCRVNIFSTARFADEYSEQQLLEFLDSCGGNCPVPMVSLDRDNYREDNPQIVENESEWSVLWMNNSRSKKALAVQEYLGQGYRGVSSQMLKEMGNIQDWEPIVPVDSDTLENNF